MKYETLLYKEEDDIGILTINRPQSLNSINRKMMEELQAFWTERGADLKTKVVILTAAGDRGFCAGLDIKEAPEEFNHMTPDEMFQYQIWAVRTFTLMRQAPQPIICCIHKSAAGAGFSMTMACDIRVITPEAKFIASFINVGLTGTDAGSSFLLPKLIGAGRAYEFLLTGDFMYAEDAMNLGFASRMVKFDELLPTAMAIAKKIATKSPLSIRLTKEAINHNIDAAGLEQAVHVENRNQVMAMLANKIRQSTPFIINY